MADDTGATTSSSRVGVGGVIVEAVVEAATEASFAAGAVGALGVEHAKTQPIRTTNSAKDLVFIALLRV
jgi:hypothetical protein